jgi:hypothetical protein
MLETRHMRPVERPLAADRHAYAVQRDGIVAPYGFEGPMRGSASAHIVLGVDFEESTLRTFGDDRGV